MLGAGAYIVRRIRQEQLVAVNFTNAVNYTANLKRTQPVTHTLT